MPRPRFLPWAGRLPAALLVLLCAVAARPQGTDPFAAFAPGPDDPVEILARAEHPDSLRSEEAVYLLERWSFAVTGADSFALRHRALLQILSRAGAEQFASLNFAYRASEEPPRVARIRIIGAGGAVREISPAAALTKPMAGEKDVVEDTRMLMIATPGLQPGDILDIVTEERRGSPLWRSVANRCRFGRNTERVREEIVELAAPVGLPVTVRASGPVPPASEAERDGLRRWTWIVRDQAPRDEGAEESGPSAWETGAWVGFSTGSSWEEAGRDYGAWFWPQAAVTDRIRELARDLTRGERGRDAQVAALFAHVAGKLGTLADERGIGSLVPTVADSVVERGFGDCKDRVVLLIALLEAAGVEALPALVRTAPEDDIAPDFVAPQEFTHMIAWLPKVGGGVFCDPALGDTCLARLPPSVAGRLALVVPREGAPALRRTPPARPDDQGYDLVADLRPLSEAQAEIRVRCEFRGELSTIVHAMLAYADTSFNAFTVDRWLGYGLWETCRRRSWNVLRHDCDALALEATYIDTAWASPRRNTLRFRYTTEVADPGYSYPEPKDRKTDVVIDWPFHDTVTLRLHDGAGWIASAKIATVALDAPGYGGRVSARERREGDDRFVEVRQEFTLREPRMAPETYRVFHRDWTRMRVSVAQPYQYDRALDEGRLRTIADYVRDNPHEGGFALEAAQQILGEDSGGRGPAGNARRAAARRLLEPVVASPETGTPALLLLSALTAYEGNVRAADSLMAACLEREPSNRQCQQLALIIKRDLGDLEGQIALTRRLVDGGFSDRRPELVQLLYEARRDDEARALERRILLFGGTNEDTTAIRLARALGYASSSRFAPADSAVAQLEGRLGEQEFAALREDVLASAGRYLEAVELAEKGWTENPLSAYWCNNLAWYYALLGRDLDQAEDLARAAVVLSGEEAGNVNTLGAVCARRGRWDEARALFEQAYSDNDSPEDRAVNAFFLGLCDWQAGRRDEARVRWRSPECGTARPPYDQWAARALELDAQGKSPLGACFVGVE